uniref:Uncharacterized protein n=1 Tax=Rhizophora mucronata TaxID=61149 RepID=A0A2P2IM92_RHIMU
MTRKLQHPSYTTSLMERSTGYSLVMSAGQRG